MPDPNQEDVSLRKVEGGIAAVLKFSGKPTEDIVAEKERILRSSLLRDGLKPKTGCLLARYNDPGQTWNFIMVHFSLLLSDYSYLMAGSSLVAATIGNLLFDHKLCLVYMLVLKNKSIFMLEILLNA